MSGSGIAYLVELERIIEQRKAAPPDQSYTARLYGAGRSRIAQKVGEEAVELVIASMQSDRPRIVAEAADLLYHLLVLLQVRGLGLRDAEAVLEARGS